MPICIGGMHRSGTSLVARALNLAGLWLGPDDDLLPAAPDNPEDFWQNAHFVRINDRVLSALGGAWDLPPSAANGWEKSDSLAGLREDAERLTRGFEEREPWGWKDPRNSLTIPFWQDVVPELGVVICVRHPLDVARSLAGRGGSSLRFSLRLWVEYNERLLRCAPKRGRVLTHYSAYFRDGRAELRRVLKAMGVAAPDAALDRGVKAVSLSSEGDISSTTDLKAAGSDIAALYERLCHEAGPVAEAALAERRPGRRLKSVSKAGTVERVASAADYKSDIDPVARDARSMHDRIAELDSALAEQARWAEQIVANIAERDRLIKQLQGELSSAAASSALEIERLQKLIDEQSTWAQRGADEISERDS
jgi:hypothetical protein